MARVQGMTPEGIRKAIAEAIAFIKDLNVEDLNKLLAAFEDANGIFDVRLVEAQEEVKKAGEKALEAEAQAKLIIEELARYQELQDAETDRILAEVATAIEAANLASDQLPALFERLTTAEAGLDFANTEFDTLIVKQDEFRDAVAEQTAEVARLNTEFVAVNQAAADAVEKVDQSTIKVNQIGGDLELAKATLDAKIKQNQEDITEAQKVADEHQNAIETLTGNLDGLTTDYSNLSSNFSTEVEKLEAADASLLSSMNTKVGALNATTAAQATAISEAKAQADKGVSDASAASLALSNYKTVNDPKVAQAQKDAAKGIEDASAALTRANTAAGQLPGMNTAISNAASEAKKANDALPALSSSISTLTRDLATATGNLTGLEENVSSKITALEAMDATQAGEITAAKQQADKGIQDAQEIRDTVYSSVESGASLVAYLPGTETPIWAQNMEEVPASENPDGLKEAYIWTSMAGSVLAKNIAVTPGVEYRTTVWLKADKPGSRIYLELRDQDGAHAVRSGAVGGGGTYLIGNMAMPTEWTKYETVMRLRDNVQRVRIGARYANHANGTERNAVQYVADLRVDPVIPLQGDVEKAQRDATKGIADAKAVDNKLPAITSTIAGIQEAQAGLGAKAQQGIDDAKAIVDIIENTVDIGTSLIAYEPGTTTPTWAVGEEVTSIPASELPPGASSGWRSDRESNPTLPKRPIKVSPSVTYRVTAWIKADGPGGAFLIGARSPQGSTEVAEYKTIKGPTGWWSGGSNSTSYVLQFRHAPTEWTEYEAHIKFNERAEYIWISGTTWSYASSSHTRTTHSIADLRIEPIIPSQAAVDKAQNDALQNHNDILKAQADINTAQGDINANNSAFQTWQTAINGRRDAWEKASTNATKALADLTTEQGKVLAIQTELSKKRDRWESGATLAIDNLTNFSVRQNKWNKASTDATNALTDASKAQIAATSANTTALQGLTAASMLAFPHLNVAPNDSSGRPWWSIGMSVNGNYTPPGFPSGESYWTSSSSISNVNPEALITVVPGIDYKLEFWTARVDEGTAGAYTDVRDEHGNVALTHWADVSSGMPTEISWSARNYAGGALPTSTAWVRKVYLLRVRSGTEKMALHFRPGNTATTNGTRVRFWGAHLSAFMPIQEQIDATQTAALASHAALFEGQNKWNAVATAAIESQATLLAKQARWSDGVDKALAWQDQLNNTQSDINKTTKSVLANQAKWNSAQAKVNDSQSNINKATKLVLDNQAKWNTAQEKVNNDQSDLNEAVRLVHAKQEEWNSGVSKALAAHDELFKTTSSTFKAVKEVNTNQGKWNTAVSDLITTNKNVTAANKTAIEGLNRVLGLRYSSSNVVPMVPGGVRTGGTDIAPIFTPTPGWMTKGTRVTVTDIPGITSIDAIQQTGPTTHQFTPYYSEIDPTIEYKYSYWAKANVASTRIYIELRSPESSGLTIVENNPDNHSTSGGYIAGNTLLAVGWKQYTGTIKFSPDVRTIYVYRIYYSHANGAPGTQTLADIQIYPNIPSQADVNKALTDSDAAQNTLLKKQKEWNDAASRSIATVESLWGKTENEVGELNKLTEALGDRITDQGKDFAKSISETMTNVPRIAYAEDGQNVSSSATDGFVKILRYKSGSQTTRTDVEAVGDWVGTMIVEGDHGQSGGTNQTFLNYTPIRKKFAVKTGTRLFRMWRNTDVDHIGAVKVTYFVDPGRVVPIYPSGGESYPDQDAWKVLFSEVAPETTGYNISLNVTWAAATHNDNYGVRIRVGSTVVTEIKKNEVGPLFPGQSGVRSMPIGIGPVKVPKNTRIYLEAYSNAGGSTRRRILKWHGQMSYITSGRG